MSDNKYGDYCQACEGRKRSPLTGLQCKKCNGTGSGETEPRDLDEMLSDHGDLEGVFGELLGDSEEFVCGVCGDELIMTDEEQSGICQNCLNE